MRQVQQLVHRHRQGAGVSSEQDTPEERDFEYRQLRDFNRRIMQDIDALVQAHPEIAPQVRLMYDRSGIKPPAATPGSRSSSVAAVGEDCGKTGVALFLSPLFGWVDGSFSHLMLRFFLRTLLQSTVAGSSRGSRRSVVERGGTSRPKQAATANEAAAHYQASRGASIPTASIEVRGGVHFVRVNTRHISCFLHLITLFPCQ